jgi:hypothetical protein
LVLLVAVDADGGVVLGEQVAQELGHQALLAVHHGRRALRVHPLPDLLPHLVKEFQVAEDVFLGPPGGRGADDDAAVEALLLAEVANDPAQAVALVARVDLARDAHMIDGRHEDEEAAGQRGVRRQARALGPQRFLDHLDHHVLPFLEQVLDFRLVSRLARLVGASTLAPATPAPPAGVAALGRLNPVGRRGCQLDFLGLAVLSAVKRVE